MIDIEKTKDDFVNQILTFKDVEKILLVGSGETINEFRNILNGISFTNLSYEFKEDKDNQGNYLDVIDVSNKLEPKRFNRIHLKKSHYEVLFNLFQGENVHQIKQVLNMLLRDIDLKSTIN